ncbi:MAG: hypothetical protein FJ288_08250 [Planctomycetes bacterium]|nr:hypothetical protein [Planctomycetota bacterium]
MARVMLIAILAAAAAGCRSEEPSSPPPETAASAPRALQAVEPAPWAQDVTRRPVLRWRLPTAIQSPQMVSVRLVQVGQMPDPRQEAGQEKVVALASGLAETSPTELDLFSPPAQAVLTGDVRDLTQLEAHTWYRWHVRVIGDGEAAAADFYFRTRLEDAAPAAPARTP